jgi:hypothetical protein
MLSQARCPAAKQAAPLSTLVCVPTLLLLLLLLLAGLVLR